MQPCLYFPQREALWSRHRWSDPCAQCAGSEHDTRPSSGGLGRTASRVIPFPGWAREDVWVSTSHSVDRSWNNLMMCGKPLPLMLASPGYVRRLIVAERIWPGAWVPKHPPNGRGRPAESIASIISGSNMLFDDGYCGGDDATHQLSAIWKAAHRCATSHTPCRHRVRVGMITRTVFLLVIDGCCWILFNAKDQKSC